MRDDTPSVYLLAGPASPAKAAYAKTLAELGVAEVPAGADDATVVDLLLTHLRSGRDAFVDEDLSDPGARERRKALVEEHGGQWCLINFTVDHTSLDLPIPS
jgi:hypothetical protein